MLGNARGLHTLAKMWRTVIVVVHELPEDASTLRLRLFGRGNVQLRAVQLLEEISRRGLLGDATLQLLVAGRQSLPQPSERSDEEHELAMNLEQVYERWARKVKAQGKLEGKRRAARCLAPRGRHGPERHRVAGDPRASSGPPEQQSQGPAALRLTGGGAPRAGSTGVDGASHGGEGACRKRSPWSRGAWERIRSDLLLREARRA
jgi:hypothetical protein